MARDDQMRSAFRVVIPARYASSRLPGKPLADIAGKPMIVRVAEAASRSGAVGVWVATDDQRIVDSVQSHGHAALLTAITHASGTDRVAEVAERLAWGESEIVVNVQGDEPLVDPRLIDALAAVLVDVPEAAMATACHALTDAAEFFNPNVVKVVTDSTGRALYFSRAPIPWDRNAFAVGRDALPTKLPARRHIGIYAYRVGFLRRFGRLSVPAVEDCEALEQLRALWHGEVIRVVTAETAPAPGVDTPEDLARVRRLFDAASQQE